MRQDRARGRRFSRIAGGGEPAHRGSSAIHPLPGRGETNLGQSAEDSKWRGYEPSRKFFFLRGFFQIALNLSARSGSAVGFFTFNEISP
jgi:hypothetical protein